MAFDIREDYKMAGDDLMDPFSILATEQLRGDSLVEVGDSRSTHQRPIVYSKKT